MSKFIELKDYDASIHSEILQAVTRNDKKLVEVCQNRAIQEMRGYMSARYDCNAIFSASGKNRIDLVVMYCIDMAVYHISCIHNPQKISQIRKDRYQEAKTWLEGVRDGIIQIEGAPLLDSRTEEASQFDIISNHKRQTFR